MLSNDSSDPESYVAAVRFSTQPFFPLWCAAAGDLVGYLAEPLEDTTAFLVRMTSGTSATDILRLVYRHHGRLQTFCIVQAFITTVVFVSGVASCRGRGQLPFLGAGPGRYVFHCVAIGATMVLILSNLVVMLGCHSKLSDGLQQLPGVYARALVDLKLYVNETVSELYTELEEEEGVSQFLTKALHVKLLRQEERKACNNADDFTSSRTGSCLERNAPVGPTEALREGLEKQRDLALLGLQEMERNGRAFETRTRLWAYAQLVGLVVIPVTMVKLCAILALLGFGVGFGLRNHAYWWEADGVRYTGVLMLANAVLILLFYVLGSPLLMILVATGLTGECYLCKPYRERSYHGLQALTAVAWPARGELFARLVPQQILTKCSGDGVSIAELELQSDVETERVDANETGTVTAGNCRPVYNILKTSLDLVCGLCIQDVLGVALSLALTMVTLLVVLPSVLTLSQFFFANRPYDSPSGNNRVLAETSVVELVSRAKSGKSSGLVGRLLHNFLGRGSTFLSNPWHSRLAEIYREEGVDIDDVISTAGSRSDVSRLSSKKRKKPSSKNRRRVKKRA